MSSRLLAISLSTLLATGLTLFSSASQAADAASNLLALHQLRLAAQKSLGDFYMYNAMEGDQRYARLIDQSQTQASQHLQALAEMPGEGSRVLLAQLDEQWRDYRSALDRLIKALKQQGYTDLQPVADLGASNQQLLALSNALYSKIEQESQFKVAPLTQQSRDQSLLMQAIAVDYAARNASVGATFMGGGEVRPIEEMVDQFAAGLANLQQATRNDAQLKQTLSTVGTKWRYIEKSLMNYNENSVPFLVNKYSDSIIEGLERVSAQYAATRS
ncbi:hypothetical protein I0E98_19840 [Pseudomonas lalucatii]|nr:hypothetical protein [Pseudomonas lalucatii]